MFPRFKGLSIFYNLKVAVVFYRSFEEKLQSELAELEFIPKFKTMPK